MKTRVAAGGIPRNKFVDLHLFMGGSEGSSEMGLRKHSHTDGEIRGENWGSVSYPRILRHAD